MAAADRPHVMRRKATAIAAAVSLLLCGVTVAVGVRSRSNEDFVYHFADDRMFELSHAHGMVLVGWGEYRTYSLPGWKFSTRPVLPRATYEEYWQTRGGFSVHRKAQHGAFNGSNIWELVLPYWAIVCLFAAAPAWFALTRLRSAHRRTCGLCPTCGYDLRATPDRCPECGAVPRPPHNQPL